jgi:pimeloyl-ACP methyl ester carboxylesterase
VLVPGLGAPGYLLDAVAAIGSWTRCSLLDLPGFGNAGPDACAADVESVAAAVVDRLAIMDRPVVLGGHSTGAQAALRAAAAAPDRVAALILAGITFEPAARRIGGLLTRVPRLLLHESPGELRAVLPAYVAGGRRGVGGLLRSGMADRPEDVLAHVRCPVLVLRGRYDPLCGAAWAHRLAGLARDGVVLTMPGAHNFPYGHAGATSLAVARFVEAVGRGQAGRR